MTETTDEPNRDAWTTSLAIATMVGRVQLDPCSNDRSVIAADRTFDLSRGQCGISLARFVPKKTRTWINCPYSHGQVLKWVVAYRHTRFTYFLRFDVSTEWWAELWPSVEALCAPRERVEFDPPPGVERVPGSPFPHVLLYSRYADVTDEVKRACYVMVKGAR